MDQPHFPTPQEAIFGVVIGVALAVVLTWGLYELAAAVAKWWG